MAGKVEAVLILLVVMATGFLIAFNLMHVGDFGLNLSWQKGAWIVNNLGVVIARLVGVAMMGVSGWVIYLIIRD